MRLLYRSQMRFLGASVKQVQKATINILINQSAWNSAAPTERVFVELHIRHFHYNLSIQSVFG
jgi:hypothetical protein